jgi:cytoskeletal protein CcmA (bactofilin family)
MRTVTDRIKTKGEEAEHMADPKLAEAPQSAKKTLVEEGTEFRGALTSNCPVVVSGRIDGELNAPALTVTGSGSVRGKARVGEILSEGEIAGEFDAERITLSGRVSDNTIIRAKSLEVNLRSDKAMQVTFGDCMLEVGEEPRKGSQGGGAPKGEQKAEPQPKGDAPKQ